MCRYLGALLVGVHRLLPSLYNAVVDAVLDIRALVWMSEKQFVICFVLGKKQRHIAFAGKNVFTQQRMSCRDRTRAFRCLDLPEVRFRGGSVGFGNPR